ncbi:beta-N-acetylhexosaminidase [Gramella sp. AN32]|uniref:beta-N-acetylhexosaminidase n=1 Tax=Christiangramia antarctica TaxID=2058158 RepID=A0ABW5X0Z6_9FLAO|nr:beta-N-acetylhexosaminidase [Gramella sp. AN32]MCM4155693.1 beta-N-acetylglucosaminidase [Gramella sp. AN32]
MIKKFALKISLLIFIPVLFFSCGNKYDTSENVVSDYNIIPKPEKLIPANGRFVLDENVKIEAKDGLQNEVEYFKEYLTTSNPGLKFGSGSRKMIRMDIDAALGNEEAYNLLISPDEIKISGATAKGIFYALQSLKQLRMEEDGLVMFPSVNITDSPRLAYRGMHLDVARHFFDVGDVKKYLDILALHKINTFHWHLTEDQGWRIEIKQYPKLTEIGAFRNGTINGKYPGDSNDNKRYGGFYTQEEIKDVLAYAEKRHITVIPEIEMPGHGIAAIAAYPYLSCFPEEKTVVPENMMSKGGKEKQANGQPKIVQESWGVYEDVFCAGSDSTFTFLENVIDEVAALFPSEYIHIGGDECPKANWERCPKCQQRMADLGLKDEHELQSYFIQRMEKYINSKGKKIIGWDEILEGGLAPNATVMSWRGEEGGIEAAKQKHDVIMTPTGYFYFDYHQAQDISKEPLGIGGYLPLEKVYSYNPEPEALTSQETAYILGVQANVWTEYIEEFEKLEYMTLPRMAALAEVGWTQESQRNWEDFKKRLPGITKVYEANNYNYAKRVDEPLVKK